MHASATRFLSRVKGASEKKPTAGQSHSKCRANRQCTAAGCIFALSPTAGAPPKVRRGAGTSRSVFSLKSRAASRTHTDLGFSPTRSVWHFHVPRIWIGSINGCEIPVKRKNTVCRRDFNGTSICSGSISTKHPPVSHAACFMATPLAPLRCALH